MKICKIYLNIIGIEFQSEFELCSTSLQFYVSFDFILNDSHNSFSPPLFGVHQEEIILLQWVLNLALSTFQTWHMKLFAQKYFQASFFNSNTIYILYHTVILHWNLVLISVLLSAIYLCFLLLPLFLLFTYLRHKKNLNSEYMPAKIQQISRYPSVKDVSYFLHENKSLCPLAARLSASTVIWKEHFLIFIKWQISGPQTSLWIIAGFRRVNALLS